MTSWEQHQTGLLKATQAVAEELINHSMVIQHLKQIGKVKKLNKWVPHKLTENQENRHFDMLSSLILCNNSGSFLDWIMTCGEKWIVYDNLQWPSQWLDWEEAPKCFPKTFFILKKCHGYCLVVCCWSDPLQLSESGENHYIWEICSSNWWDALKTVMPAASIGQQKGPNSFPWPRIAQQMLQKLNELGQVVLPHPPYSPDLSPTNYHFSKHLDNFLQGKGFHNQ